MRSIDSESFDLAIHSHHSSLPHDPDYFDDLIIKVERLLTVQHESFTEAFDGIDLRGPGQ